MNNQLLLNSATKHSTRFPSDPPADSNALANFARMRTPTKSTWPKIATQRNTSGTSCTISPEPSRSSGFVQSLEDLVVPITRITEQIPHFERLSEEFGIRISCYRHAGDGNLNATFVKAEAMSPESWEMACCESSTQSR
jgi:hypothetical protein